MSWSVVPPEERLVERTDLRPIHRHNLNHIKRRTLQSHKVNSSCRRFLSLMLSSRSIRCRDVKHHHHLYARCTSTSVIYHVRVVCFCCFSWASSLTQFSLKSWTDCESQSESTCLDSAVIKFHFIQMSRCDQRCLTPRRTTEVRRAGPLGHTGVDHVDRWIDPGPCEHRPVVTDLVAGTAKHPCKIVGIVRVVR